MIGLPDGWDDDLYAEDVGLGGGLEPILSFGADTGIRPSKATELLQRVRELCPGPGSAFDLPARGAPTAEPMDWFSHPSPWQPGLSAEGGAPAALPDVSMDGAGAGAAAVRRTGLGVFGEAELPAGGDADVRAWRLGSSFSFRASMKGHLVAQPFVDPRSGGTYKVRLLQLQPRLLRPWAPAARSASSSSEPVRSDFDEGSDLLEAQFLSGFLQQGSACEDGQPPRLELRPDRAQALLELCLRSSRLANDVHAKETFELMHNFSISPAGPGAKEPGPPDDAQTLRRLSSWLASVNTRKVRTFLARESRKSQSFPRVSGADRGSAVDNAPVRLKAVYHHLTANSVRGALEELDMATAEVPEGSSIYFDRLAAMISACGGVSSPCKERRQFLREQISQWRSQGVNDLMGSALWRIYCLLAGDLDEVIADTVDWRTAFALFVWYRCPVESEERLRTHDLLLAAVRAFEAAVTREGVSCCFRPVPPCAELEERAVSIRALTQGQKVTSFGHDAGPFDLQFSVIRSAIGAADWSDLRFYDYTSHTACPLDVVYSWHISLIFLALRGGDTSVPGFQQLTQQYCFLLELAGLWDRALHVALFMFDARSRAAAVRGLLLRSAGTSTGEELKRGLARQRFEVPAVWCWRAQAVRREWAKDWPAAVTGWLRCQDYDRALIIALGCVQGLVISGHTSAPFQRGSADLLSLVPITPTGRWLLGALEEAVPFVVKRSDALAEAAKDALRFMRDWASNPSHAYDATELTRLYWRCDMLRCHTLGIPW